MCKSNHQPYTLFLTIDHEYIIKNRFSHRIVYIYIYIYIYKEKKL